ncbi:MAG TPA: GAF domain-containing sensor histidine kinase [Dehalococcoidia bacterium]
MDLRPTYSVEDIRALAEAGVSLTSELSLEAVLQKVVDVARQHVGAGYAALSVLSAGGEIERFISSGITEEERERIGHLPRGKGLLGVLLNEGVRLRLDDMSKDPRSTGFPPSHPKMKSLLGVPVIWRGKIIGNLYLTEKQGDRRFDERDEELICFLATQAAVAITNARLYNRLESLARLEERERIGMDLHDGVIQSIYGVGLHLEDCSDRLPANAQDVKPDLDQAIDDLNEVIKDIRSYIFDLRPQLSSVDDLPVALDQLVEHFRVNTLTSTSLAIDSALQAPGGQTEAMALFHVAQEALNNVAKHAKASSVSVSLRPGTGGTILEVSDNGVGFDAGSSGDYAGAHHGMRNMRDRARSAGGVLEYESSPGNGTTVRLTVPTGRKDKVDG